MLKNYLGKSPDVHLSAFVEDSAQVIGDVSIGEDASVWFNAVVRGDVNQIRIGARTNIQDGTVIHVTERSATVLEEEITVGHNATLHGCYVERGCLIGMGAIVLDDVRVGANSLVAAGSLVPPGMQIPPGSFVIGHPARVRRGLTPEEIAGLEKNWKNYIEYKGAYLEP